MQYALIPPREPQRQPVRAPMVYVEKRTTWEYKQMIRDLEKERLPEAAELNELGKEGWELCGVAQQAALVYFYFKRSNEK